MLVVATEDKQEAGNTNLLSYLSLEHEKGKDKQERNILKGGNTKTHLLAVHVADGTKLTLALATDLHSCRPVIAVVPDLFGFLCQGTHTAETVTCPLLCHLPNHHFIS